MPDYNAADTVFDPGQAPAPANPAQVMRLTQAALWKRGGRLHSSFEGRAVCADIIVTTMQTGEAQVILPCSGDRIFGQTQDHEMAFAIPWARMEEIVEGLRGTHAGGIRYPITQFMEYEAKLPPRYMEVNRLWDAEKGKAPAEPSRKNSRCPLRTGAVSIAPAALSRAQQALDCFVADRYHRRAIRRSASGSFGPRQDAPIFQSINA